jgi:hypothetical protein
MTDPQREEFQNILNQANLAVQVFEESGNRAQFVAVSDQIHQFIEENFTEEEKRKLHEEKMGLLGGLYEHDN